MSKPTPKVLSEAVGITASYASMILSDSANPQRFRIPPRSLAILIYRQTKWRHPSIADLTESQMKVFEAVDPWTPKARAA